MKDVLFNFVIILVMCMIFFVAGTLYERQQLRREDGVWVQYTYDDLLGWHIHSIQNDYAGGLVYSNPFPKASITPKPPKKFNQ